MIKIIEKLRAMLSPARDEIRFVGDMKRLQLQPGDVLVISTESPLSEEICERMKGYLLREFDGHRAIVLSDGLQICAVGPGSQSMASLIQPSEDGR